MMRKEVDLGARTQLLGRFLLNECMQSEVVVCSGLEGSLREASKHRLSSYQAAKKAR